MNILNCSIGRQFEREFPEAQYESVFGEPWWNEPRQTKTVAVTPEVKDEDFELLYSFEHLSYFPLI